MAATQRWRRVLRSVFYLLLIAVSAGVVHAGEAGGPADMGGDAYWRWSRPHQSHPGLVMEVLPNLPELATVHLLASRQIFRSAVPEPLQSRVSANFFRDGKEVLDRSFPGTSDELPARVLIPGHYQVFLKAWYLDRYWRISEILTYVISPDPTKDTVAYGGVSPR